jgi:N-acetyl-anhydromuramyl-L-alanine amidase AmpD
MSSVKSVIVTIVVAVGAVVGYAMVTNDIDLSGGPPAERTVAITVPVPGPDVVVKADADTSFDPAEQQAAEHAGLRLHQDTRDETPPGVSREALEAGEQRTADLAEKELLKPEHAAGAQNYSCKRRPVVNQSALTSKRVGVALHFTVSDPGSLNAIFGLFNRRSFGASSNYGFELVNLKCEQWVSEGRKAWAQGTANSAYVSIEIVSKDRSRSSWLATPALRRGVLASLVRDIAKRVGAPLRLVDPRGCVFLPGITDHDRLECGNSHWDVGRSFPWNEFMRQVKQGSSPNPLTARQQRACDRLNFHRGRAHQLGKWFPARRARAEELKQQIPRGRCPSPHRS